MKILVISTLYTGGGAEIQSKFEFDLFKSKGHDVRYITFDPALESGVSMFEGHINLIGHYSQNARRLFDIIRNPKIEKEMALFLYDFKPDVVHLHQISYAVKSIYFSVRNCPTLQTIHDYSVVCDKGTCILPNGMPCIKAESKECLGRCYSESFKSNMKYFYRQFVRKGIHQYRMKYVDMFISPSECLTKYLNQKAYKVICINNAIDTNEYSVYQKHIPDGKKIVLYYGAIRKAKGVQQLIEAYDPERMPDIELHLIGGFDKGRIEDCYCEEEFMKIVKEKGIVFHGKMSHEKIIQFLQQVFAVVIPSMWMENYPTTAIEGIYGKCVVAGSNRGGVPELIAEKQLIFDVMDQNSIKKTLLAINAMSKDDYEAICSKQMLLFNNNNMPDIYIKKLLGVINEVMADYES